MILNDVLAATLLWFKKAVPTPTQKNLSVQVGVHLEEVGEFLDQIHSTSETTNVLLNEARRSMHVLADNLKNYHHTIHFPDRVATLDGICDQLVTGTGVAHMLKMDPLGGLSEVNRSNFSKFVDGEPLFTEQGKIMKGPHYSKPALDSFV